MGQINFYKKQTVLNDILKNQNIILVDDNQLNNVINTVSTSEYMISNNVEVDSENYQNTSSYLTKLYISYYGVTLPLISNKDIISNIKRYNKCEISSVSDENNNYINIQDNKYKNYDLKTTINSLLFNYSYNKLYYVQNDKINLMSYLLDIKNGFNYNNDNHMLYFNIDNKYICSINNTLYYNFNKIRETSKNDIGVSLLDNKYINTKNVSHNNVNNLKYYYGVLDINQDFKYNVFITLNKLKTLYNKCEDMYNTLSYYITVDDYNNNYFNFINFNTTKETKSDWYPIEDGNHPETTYYEMKKVAYHTIYDIKFEDTKLLLTDSKLGINKLDISNEDTIYINDLNNISFEINITHTYISSSNYNYFKPNTSMTVENNNIDFKLSYIYDYKSFIIPITTNFIETSSTIFENQVKTSVSQITKKNITKYPIKTTYNILIQSDIDKNIFNNSGLTIKYQASPYLNKNTSIDFNVNSISYSNIIVNEENENQNYNCNWKINTYTYYYHNQIVLPNSKELNIRKFNNKIEKYYSPYIACHRSKLITSTNGYSYFILSSKNLVNFQYEVDGNNIFYKPEEEKKWDGKIINERTGEPEPVIIPPEKIPDIAFRSPKNSGEQEYGVDPGVNCLKDTNNKTIKVRTHRIKINDNLMTQLKSRKLLIPQEKISKLGYYKLLSLYEDNKNYYECYPILDSYPNKYINEKFFDSEIYKINTIPNNEELNTCISEIKNIFYDNITTKYTDNILYLYEINCTEEGNVLICYSLVNEDGYPIDGENNLIVSGKENGIINVLYPDIQDSNLEKIVTRQNLFSSRNILGKNYPRWYLYRYLSLYLNHSIRLY